MEIRNGEFYFKKKIAGSSISVFGKVWFDHDAKKWTASIYDRFIAQADDSDEAVIKCLSLFLGS
jgi:hypothetical protein